MFKSLIAAALLFASWAASAATYYVCDNQTGAHASTVAGDNTRSASAAQTSTTPWRTLAAVTTHLTGISSLPAGTVLRFCQGGSWTSFNISVANASTTAASPLAFESYAPSWGATARPLLNMAVGGSAGITINSGGITGLVLRGLRIDGGGRRTSYMSGGNPANPTVADPGPCIFVNATVARAVTIDNTELFGCALGIHLGTLGTFWNVRNSYITDNWWVAGILGPCTDCVVEKVAFSRNGCGDGSCHHIYISGDDQRATYRYNTFSGAGSLATGNAGVCSSGGITVHGKHDQMLIEGNTFSNTTYTGACGGISANPGYSFVRDLDDEEMGAIYDHEYEKRLVIRGNLMTNAAQVPIGCTSCPGVLIENNVVVNTHTGAGNVVGIAVPAFTTDTTEGYADEPDSAPIIRNNSLYLGAAPNGSFGLRLNAGNGHGSGARVTNNLVYFTPATSGTQACFNLPVRASYAAMDRNLCYGGDVYAATFPGLATTYANLAAAQSGCPSSGFDCNGSAADPLLRNTPTSGNSWDMQIQSTSPARNAGDASNCARLTFKGLVRSHGGVCDVGAYEYGVNP